MNILITGVNGFVGKNLTATLEQNKDYRLYKVTQETTSEELEDFAKDADFIFHLAGVNRPKNEAEFYEGNIEFTQTVINALIKADNKAPLLITSSIRAGEDSAYGESKKAGEDLVIKYGIEYGVKTYVYRLPNLFGKWSRPNYNSVIATFSYKIARDEEIVVNDSNAVLTLAYIDDVIAEFINALNNEANQGNDFYEVPITYQKKLGHIAELLKEFRHSRTSLVVSNLADEFTTKLYSTYLSYLPTDDFAYPLTMHADHRGAFTEFVKSPFGGQVSVNVSKAGITKGEHWHHSKNEKFLVVSGQGKIRFRDYYSDEVIEYNVSGDKLEVVDIPTGYTHSIINTGEQDMVTIMWVNEMFNPDIPDTYYLEVDPK